MRCDMGEEDPGLTVSDYLLIVVLIFVGAMIGFYVHQFLVEPVCI